MFRFHGNICSPYFFSEHYSSLSQSKKYKMAMDLTMQGDFCFMKASSHLSVTNCVDET